MWTCWLVDIKNNLKNKKFRLRIWHFVKLQATIGIDFLSKTMYLEDRTVRLQLWWEILHLSSTYLNCLLPANMWKCTFFSIWCFNCMYRQASLNLYILISQGYCWAREISESYSKLHQRFFCGSNRLWCG